LNSDAVAIDLLDIQVGSLGEILACVKLLWIPERLTGARQFLGSALLAAFLSATTDSSAEDEGSCIDEGLSDLGLRLGGAGVG